MTAVLSGRDNLVWSPGNAVRLFGLPGETLAVQVVVTAGREPLRDVAVEIRGLQHNTHAPEQQVHAELWVVGEVQMDRRSGGKHARESLGWTAGALPAAEVPASVPEPLFPVAHAPAWADYPMTVVPGEHRVVWIDLAIPEHDVPSGVVGGAIVVRGLEGDRGTWGRELPVELEIGPARLPYAAVKTMVYFDPAEILGRVGDAGAIDRFLRLMHSHHLSVITKVLDASDVDRYADWLTGSLFRSQRGYRGPGQGVGSNVVALGAYGALGAPSAQSLRQVGAVVRRLAELGVRDAPGAVDVFVYAVDEQCDSPLGPQWRSALESAGEALRGVRVAQTCSREPAGQDVDIAMVLASEYSPSSAGRARSKGKHVWIYNGVLPHTGAFLTDADVLSLRANGWIQELHGIERWFYWESTFWNDDNRGGYGPYDPLRRAETFHNQHGDHCNGDGVLVYPGRQPGEWRSAGYPGVLPSIRLKQWRRGISDAGYLQLARKVDPTRTERIARALIPASLDQADPKRGASWPSQGAAFLRARRELFDIIRSATP